MMGDIKYSMLMLSVQLVTSGVDGASRAYHSPEELSKACFMV